MSYFDVLKAEARLFAKAVEWCLEQHVAELPIPMDAEPVTVQELWAECPDEMRTLRDGYAEKVYDRLRNRN